jgi:hypothetical protein
MVQEIMYNSAGVRQGVRWEKLPTNCSPFWGACTWRMDVHPFFLLSFLDGEGIVEARIKL